MSKIHKEEVEVFGTLYTEFGTFAMLSEVPTKNGVPWYLKDQNVLSFYVADSDGFGKYILVAGNNWLIKPLSEVVKIPVSFLLDDDTKQDDN